jgi:hypothetical protein
MTHHNRLACLKCPHRGPITPPLMPCLYDPQNPVDTQERLRSGVCPAGRFSDEPDPAPWRGIGDVVASLLEKLGFRKTPGCGCEKRARWLNRWLPLPLRGE